MNNQYNQTIFDHIQNNDLYTIENNNLMKYYQKIPITIYETIIEEPIIYQTENNSISKPFSYYTYTTNDDYTYPLINKKNKAKYYYTGSPERKYNYEKGNPNIISYQTSTNENSPYSENILSDITQNKNRSRSPGISRTNNFLRNNEDLNLIPSFNSRSPGPSRNYKIITNSRLNIPKSTKKDIVFPNNPIYYNYNYNQSPNNNSLFNSETALLYPNKSNNIYYDIPNSNPSDHNIIYSIPNNASPTRTNNFINDMPSKTYQTIQNTPINENAPTIHYISNPFNSINTIPDTNQYLKMGSTNPNNIYINSFPSSSGRLLSNNYKNISAIPTIETKYEAQNSPYNKLNQYQTLVNPNNYYLPPQNIYTLQNQGSSKKVTNFQKNVNQKRKKTEPYSIDTQSNSSNSNQILKFAKKIKGYAKSSEESSSKTGKNNNIKSLLYSKAKNYLDQNSDENSNDEEEIEENNLNYNKNRNNYDKSLHNKNSNITNDERNLRIKEDKYFSQYMFRNINKIRENPKSFIPKIKKSIENISYDKKGNLIYKGKLKVALFKGEKVFKEAIDTLEKTEPMEPLVFKKELCVDISNNEKEFKSGDYLRKKIKEKINNDIPIRAFWRDIIKDPEINFLLMIVDDNPIRKGNKRKDILDPEMKYIGISSANLGNDFVCYTVLSDE